MAHARAVMGQGETAEGTGDGVLLLGIGDTHGDFEPLFEAVKREPRARAILQVGDLTAGKAGRDTRQDDDPATLANLPVPLVWVHGNHEHWEMLGLTDEGRSSQVRIPGVHLWPGEEYVMPGTEIRIAGVPGNYAPNWYEREKPFPGDRVRHFNAADVAATSRLGGVAVLLMHETFRGHSPGRLGAMGVPHLAQLVRRLSPAVCLTGHHHALSVAEHGPTLAIALPRADEGYARLWFAPDGERLGWQFVPFEFAMRKANADGD